MDTRQAIEAAQEHFGRILEQQLKRVERIKQPESWIDFSTVYVMVTAEDPQLESRWEAYIRAA